MTRSSLVWSGLAWSGQQNNIFLRLQWRIIISEQFSWNQQKNCTSHAKFFLTKKNQIIPGKRADLYVVVSTVTGGDDGEDDDSDASHCKMYVEADTRQSTHLINNNCQNQ